MTKLLVDSPIKADATSFYRAWGPLTHLARNNPDIQLINARFPGNELSWDLMSGVDIFFSQRPSTLDQSSMMRIAKSVGVPIWIDYDDDYLNIPETNPRHVLYANPHRVAHIKRAIELADVITVSTKNIFDQICVHVPSAKEKMLVIPNAIDEFMFDTSIPTEPIEDRKTILWRGGDTHDHDIKPYTDAIVKAYNDNPEYEWVFIGHIPWRFVEMLDCKRVKQYDWAGVMEYFQMLFEVKPKFTIVPWAENQFNKGKSSCAWMESTLAGGATLFPFWSTEYVPGMAAYEDVKGFENMLSFLMSTDVNQFVKESFSTLQDYTLKYINRSREDLLANLKFKPSPQFGFRQPVKRGIPATHEEAYSYDHEIGGVQDNEGFLKAHGAAADWLIDTVKPVTAIEFGCGAGALIERLLDRKVPLVIGYDLNPLLRDYFIKRNPHFVDAYRVENFLEIEWDGVADLCIAIECFEHIPADIIEPYIEKLSHHFKFIYFSSTPFTSTIEHDEWWGHINVHPVPYWKKCLQDRGWKFVSCPQKLCGWDLLFESTNAKSDENVGV